MTPQQKPTRRGIGWGLASTGAALALTAAGAQVTSAAGRVPARAPATPRAGAAAREPIPARAARLLTVDDNGDLHLAHASGSILSEEGPVTGTLLGTAKVRMDVGGEEVTASFTISARGGGSIVGNGSARLSSAARYSSFGGSLSITGGSGRYAHAHGAGKLYGVLERRHDAVTFQTRGMLSY